MGMAFTERCLDLYPKKPPEPARAPCPSTVPVPRICADGMPFHGPILTLPNGTRCAYRPRLQV